MVHASRPAQSLALQPVQPSYAGTSRQAHSPISFSTNSSEAETSSNGSKHSSTDLLAGERWKKPLFQGGLFAHSREEAGEAGGLKSQRKKSGLRARIVRYATRRDLFFLSIPLIMLIILLATLLSLLPRHRNGAEALDPVADGAVVDLGYGKYRGVKTPNDISYWAGMRYAKAPEGGLRFAAPQPPDHFTGVKPANKIMKGCVGVGNALTKAGTTEDCLWIDVYAPTKATPGSKLPVFLFIQGGGLDAATGHFNASGLIQAGNKNIVAAAISYRTGIFGFLASDELKKKASLNNGIKDQRLAMQWVHDHIDKFGGDPKMVTIGGQSAGAGCVATHLTAYGGKTNDLYHAAILQSPSMPAIRTVKDSQYQYDNLVERTGCKDTSDTLACLREVPHEKMIQNARADPFPDGAGGRPVFAYNTVIDDDIVRDVPIKDFDNGNFAKVPVIMGDVSDEGTMFTRNAINTPQLARDYLKNTFPRFTSQQLDKMGELYGFKNDTQDSTWAKAALAYGEVRYVCTMLQMSSLVAKHNQPKIWNYRYDVPTNPGKNGVAHGDDLGPTFANFALSRWQRAPNAKVAQLLQEYWSSFIRTHDPNLLRTSGTPEWEEWTDGGKGKRLRMLNQGSTMELISPEQKKRCDYLATLSIGLEQ